MYPNDINSSSYLDQIAPKATPSNFFKQKPILFGLIALVAIILLFIFVLIIGLANKPTSTKRLAAKLVNTQQVSQSATANIKSTSLRAINSNLNIILTNTIRDASPVLAKEGLKIEKLDKNTLSLEPNAEMLSRLEDARLNAIYDRTYAREMAYQLETLTSLMTDVKESTGKKDLGDFLTTAINNLSPLQKQLENFDSNSY